MSKMIEMGKAMIAGGAPPPPVAQLVGFRMVEVERGRTKFELEAGPQHANPMGGLHGGILCDVADAAMGFAYASTLDEGESFTTVELKINFLRPFKTGKLIAEGRYVSGGKTIGLAEADVRDEQGNLVARAVSTCMTLRADRNGNGAKVAEGARS